MPATRRVDPTERMAELAQRVSEYSKSWRAEREPQLTKLKRNHFSHYAPGNIEEARADMRKAKESRSR